MKKEHPLKNCIKRIWEGRAARIITVAVSAFLCALTVFEFVALRMEWDIPVLAMINGGADSFLFEEYRSEEMALDDSRENILLEESENQTPVETTETSDKIQEESSEETESSEKTTEQQKNPNAEKETEESVALETETEALERDTGLTMETEATEEEQEEFPYYLKVNRQQNCITVYTKDENGDYSVPYKAIICSTGLYNATPTGTFHLSDKYLWRQLHGGVYGQYATRITGGVLFHSVPYYRKSKNSLCSDKYNKLGQQASMGCIRLTVEDAKWIAENCPSGTTVEIYDDAENPGPLGKPEAEKIDLDNPNKGWDPTDPDEENPWHQLSEDQ